jgi:hypothetical protein
VISKAFNYLSSKLKAAAYFQCCSQLLSIHHIEKIQSSLELFNQMKTFRLPAFGRIGDELDSIYQLRRVYLGPVILSDFLILLLRWLYLGLCYDEDVPELVHDDSFPITP